MKTPEATADAIHEAVTCPLYRSCDLGKTKYSGEREFILGFRGLRVSPFSIRLPLRDLRGFLQSALLQFCYNWGGFSLPRWVMKGSAA